MTPAQMAALMVHAMPDARPWSQTEFADLMTRPGAIVSGDQDAVVIGQATLDEAEVFMVLTSPDKRRQGLARAAMETFHTMAKAAGATRVILDVAADNLGAISLYTALGYGQIAERKAYYSRTKSTKISALMLEIRL